MLIEGNLMKAQQKFNDCGRVGGYKSSCEYWSNSQWNACDLHAGVNNGVEIDKHSAPQCNNYVLFSTHIVYKTPTRKQTNKHKKGYSFI